MKNTLPNRIDALANHSVIERRVATATETLRALLPLESLVVAYSGGKDSSAIANLVLSTAAELAQEGVAIEPIFIVHADTGVDNPAVSNYCDGQFSAMRDFAVTHGLPVDIRVAQPAILQRYLVRIIGGRALPTFVNSRSRACSEDLKITPVRHVMRDIHAQRRRQGKPLPVTVLGTRYTESAARGTRMQERGERPDAVVDGKNGERLLSLIADWSTDDVWEYLMSAGTGLTYPAFVHDFSATLRLYRDAAGECVIVAEARNRSSACGARHGCWMCTANGGTDRSMEAMLSQKAYAHLQGLNALRNYLVATRYDWSKRRFLGRVLDEAGCAKLVPYAYSAEMTDFLLRAALTLDRREQRRAEQVAELLRSGQLTPTPDNKRLARPQFQVLTREDIIAIDFIWATDALHRPFHALKVWHEIMVLGLETDIPVVSLTAAPPAPIVRYLSVGQFISAGCLDPLVEPIAALVDAQAPVNTTERFEISEEALWFVFEEDLPRLLARHDAEDCPSSAFFYYIRMGFVSVARSKIGALRRMAGRGQYWESAGLSQLAQDALTLPGTLSEAEHVALIGPRHDAAAPTMEMGRQMRLFEVAADAGNS